MNVYVGDGNVVTMECEETGERRSPIGHEWVLKSDVDKENQGKQLVSEKAIGYLFNNHPEAYKEFYNLIDA
jgi:hypothetical protein